MRRGERDDGSSVRGRNAKDNVSVRTRYVLGSLVIAYAFWYRGVRIIGPTRTAMYSNLQPLIAVLVAWAMLGEVPTLLQIAGAVSIMGGLLLSRA